MIKIIRRIFLMLLIYELGLDNCLLFGAREKSAPEQNPASEKAPRMGRSDNMPSDKQNELAASIMEEARKAEQQGKTGKALSLYKKITKKHPNSDYAAAAFFQTGEIRLNQKKYKKAFKAYQEIISGHPEFPKFNQVIDRQFEIAQTMMDMGEKQMLVFFSDKSMRAVEFFEQVSQNAPYRELSPRCLLYLAKIQAKKKNTTESIDALDRLINQYPTSAQAAEAYLRLAETFQKEVEGPLYDQGPTREAISYYQDYLILYPNDNNVAEGEKGLAEMKDVYAKSKLVLGQYYYKYRSDYDAAKVFFNDAITISPESPSAKKAKEYLAKIEAYETSPAFKAKLAKAERTLALLKKAIEKQQKPEEMALPKIEKEKPIPPPIESPLPLPENEK